MIAAGRDRTGVAVALLILFAGALEEVIAHIYSLTRTGVEPVRELLQIKLAEGEGKEVNWDNLVVREIAGCERLSPFALFTFQLCKFKLGHECLPTVGALGHRLSLILLRKWKICIRGKSRDM